MPDFEAAHNTIRSNFKTLIADGFGVTTLYDNDPTVTPQRGLHVVLAIDGGLSLQVEFGSSRRFRNPGSMVASIRWDVGKGDLRPLELVDAIQAAFRGVSLTQVHFRTPSVTRVGREGKWWVMNVICPYYFDETGV